MNQTKTWKIGAFSASSVLVIFFIIGAGKVAPRPKELPPPCTNTPILCEE